jgi:hypothetical protein
MVRAPISPLRGEVTLATRAREPLKIIDICLRHFGVIGSATFLEYQFLHPCGGLGEIDGALRLTARVPEGAASLIHQDA